MCTNLQHFYDESTSYDDDGQDTWLLNMMHDAVESALGCGPFWISEFAYQHFNWGLVSVGQSISSVGRVYRANAERELEI